MFPKNKIIGKFNFDMVQKPSLPKGTRDFGPEAVAKRNFIFDKIKACFQSHGYLPIETPVMESLSTLTGKYGEEGDRLLFKVLNNGDYLADVNQEDLTQKNSNKVISQISKRGLRYDLTVPFARFVAMNRNEINFPFKRFQIQQVWRADRPQKGRYQEFYQCDADIVGSDSLMYEAELIEIYDSVFTALNLPVEIMVNNRKVLEGIAETIGAQNLFIEMTVAIDKLDKIGWQGVGAELLSKGFSQDQIEKLTKILDITKLADLEPWLVESEIGLLGIEELKTLHLYLDKISLDQDVKLDLKLARGLNYYTGCILEVKAKTAAMGSLGGGGRYANLTEVFGLSGVSGVGISFGAERIFDVMEELNLFPPNVLAQPQLLIITDDDCVLDGFETAYKLRKAGIAVDLYPSPAKFKKQMKYADDRKFAFVLIIGIQEKEQQKYALKNMVTGEQIAISWDELIVKFSK